jgi:hypothetical protein
MPLTLEAEYRLTSGKVGEGNAVCRESERKKAEESRDWFEIDAAFYDLSRHEIF